MGTSASQEAQLPYKTSELSEIDISSKGKKQTSLTKKASITDSNRQGQTNLLKKLFYKLDPAVIKGGFDVEYGQVKLAIKYASRQQLLLVKVHEARNLSSTNIRGHASKPYVKVELVQNKTDKNIDLLESPENEAKCTSSLHHTDRLLFNEIFSFSIPEDSFEIVKLRCSVWSFDGLEEDEFLGETYFDIPELDCVDTIRMSWHNLHSQTDLEISGEINLHLGFKLPQSLTVTINSARHVGKANNATQSPALTVKVVIPGVPHVFQTTPVRGEDEYNWIETFTFPIPREELTNRHLICVVSNAKEEDSYLGECHIDLDSIDLSRGYESTFALSDMRGSDVVRSRWSCNAVTQELQEALYAHSVYMRPEFLFRPNSTQSKVVSVSVPRAFVHSQMRVVNGVVVQ